jgi:hypothetical protein
MSITSIEEHGGIRQASFPVALDATSPFTRSQDSPCRRFYRHSAVGPYTGRHLIISNLCVCVHIETRFLSHLGGRKRLVSPAIFFLFSSF